MANVYAMLSVAGFALIALQPLVLLLLLTSSKVHATAHRGTRNGSMAARKRCRIGDPSGSAAIMRVHAFFADADQVASGTSIIVIEPTSSLSPVH